MLNLTFFDVCSSDLHSPIHFTVPNQFLRLLSAHHPYTPQPVHHSLESTMCLWFSEVKFRYSEMYKLGCRHSVSFDECVPQTPMLI